MSKTHVNIDGVTLTRQQVEKALVELNMPEPLKLKAGMVVRYRHGTVYVVLSDGAGVALRESGIWEQADYYGVVLEGGPRGDVQGLSVYGWEEVKS